MNLFHRTLCALSIALFCSYTAAGSYAARTHYYAVEYLKPNSGTGDPTFLNITLNRKVTSAEAERLLKEEVQRAVSLFPPKRDLLAYVWLETNPTPGSEEMIKLPDGSNFIIYSVKTKQLQTEKQYDASKLKQPQVGKGIDVEISPELEKGIDGRVRILASTNLPHGMILMLDLRKVGSKYFAQDEVEVITGRIASTWFSDGGKPLPSGTYEIVISSPLPDLQSTAVRAVIGQDGENLKGSITTSMGAKMVDLTVKKSIP
ncbi:MAG: hypothetical protein ABIR48_05210 [Gammaproteobacteria bacterium]